MLNRHFGPLPNPTSTGLSAPRLLGPRALPDTIGPDGADYGTSARALSPVASAEAVLVDTAKHAAIDGTGWARDPLGRQFVRASGKIFRMVMYHPNHPDGDDEMADRGEAFDPPRAISWKPGYDADDGNLAFSGWIWRSWAISSQESGSSQESVTPVTSGSGLLNCSQNFWREAMPLGRATVSPQSECPIPLRLDHPKVISGDARFG
jgi:hypothetical protein